MGKIIQGMRKSFVENKVRIAIYSLGAICWLITLGFHYNEHKSTAKSHLLHGNAIIQLFEGNEALKENLTELEESTKELRNEVNDLKKKTEQQITSRNEYPTTSGKSIGVFETTAYTAECRGCSGITASGYDVRNTIYYNGYRIVAMDTSVVPMYSIVEISYGDTSFKAIVLDRGGDIKGKKIDLLVDTYDNAIQFGRRDVSVKLLRTGKG